LNETGGRRLLDGYRVGGFRGSLHCR
jgi:hypothetical protein